MTPKLSTNILKTKFSRSFERSNQSPSPNPRSMAKMTMKMMTTMKTAAREARLAEEIQMSTEGIAATQAIIVMTIAAEMVVPREEMVVRPREDQEDMMRDPDHRLETD